MTSTALERIGAVQRDNAVALMKSGKVSEALILLAPPSGAVEVAKKPDLPKAFVLSDERKAALSKAAKFLEEKAVTTTEVRALTPAEKAALIEERELIDQILKLAEERKESIRAMTFNHLDTEFVTTHTPEEIAATLVDAKGHYIVPGQIDTEGAAKALTRGVTGGAPTLDPVDLDAVANDKVVGDSFTHDDFLAVTRQVRVIDENLMALHMAKKPEIIEGIAAALKPGTPNTVHNFKAK